MPARLEFHRWLFDGMVRSFGAIVLLTVGCFSSGRAEAPARVDYNYHVKPLLSDRCYSCHGPDESQRQADLRLDQPESAVADRGGYAAVVAGAPQQSELIRRITSRDPAEVMPPPEAKLPPITDEEAARISHWIEQGAEWKPHWSFIPLGEVAIPEVNDASWCRNPIDCFVLASFEREHLNPSPETSREKLIRRVTFDLTGLPPTVDEIDAFLNDPAPDAYERVVDRLLASPRYGEHLAVHWLDLARYADSYGFQVDRARRVWPWRDWVIKALNENLSYDEFVTWQLAGDLLPHATDEQVLATAFNRLHGQESEGGSVPEEFRVEYVADRVHTFGTAFLGLALECSRCHDHKYDPITQREYYQLFSFFDNIDEAGLYSYHTDSTPTPALLLATGEQEQQLADIERQIAAAENAVAQSSDERHEAFESWLAKPEKEFELSGRIAHFDFDESRDGKFSNRIAPDTFATSSTENNVVAGKHGQCLKLTGDDEVTTSLGNFNRDEPFSFALWINTSDEKERVVILHRSQAWTDAGSRGYQLLIEEGRLSAALVHFWPGNAICIRTRERIPVGSWLHVAVTYDGSSRADGLRIFVTGRPADCEVVKDGLTKEITGGGHDYIGLGARTRDHGFKDGLIDDLHVFARQLSPLEVLHLGDGRNLELQPVAELTHADREMLCEYYLAAVDDVWRQRVNRLQELRAARSALADPTPEIMVMRELAEKRPTYVLKRGHYEDRTEQVAADTPQALPPLPDEARPDRLALARWLTAPNHPLTARTAVNRFWQLCFGEGLVRTANDFGSQGELPTHPELLDWLAKDFVDHGWDVKRLLKQIVTSATYRQSSECDETLRQRDPENRLWARGPRYRLSAEMLRDNALVASGLLIERIGGAPVRPYEIAVSFKPEPHDTGDGLYRRSIYTHWQRNGPAPVMAAFDASNRDVCVVKRERTTTPLQSLVLLNDPQFVEASRKLAESVLEKHADDVRSAVAEMFRRLTSRTPDDAELSLLLRLFEEQRAHFQQFPERAAEFLAVGEAPVGTQTEAPRLAAMTVVAQTLFNFDECVRKW